MEYFSDSALTAIMRMLDDAPVNTAQPYAHREDDVLAYLAEHPDATAPEIAAGIVRTVTATTSHLRRLRERGKVSARRIKGDGKVLHWTTT